MSLGVIWDVEMKIVKDDLWLVDRISHNQLRIKELRDVVVLICEVSFGGHRWRRDPATRFWK